MPRSKQNLIKFLEEAYLPYTPIEQPLTEKLWAVRVKGRNGDWQLLHETSTMVELLALLDYEEEKR